MPLSNIDFGESIVPLTGTDAFFLDTNMLVAYMYDKHEKHLPCFGLISYLIKNEVVLCTSEIVIVELINSLARVVYVDDQLTAYLEKNPVPSNIKKQERVFKGDWSNKVIKTEPETLKRYSTLAINIIEPFIQGTLLIECNDSIIEDVMRVMPVTPLASADAMIVSTVLNFGCKYIFSMDGDMSISDDVEVVTTSVNNESYDVPDMLDKLDIAAYLFDQLGDKHFRSKFPSVG
jgi:predicted nucleic acid-binding protein